MNTHHNIIKSQFLAIKIKAVYTTTSETQGFGYSHTRIQSYTVTHSWILMSVVHIKFLKKNSNLQWNYKDYGHDLGLALGLGWGLGLGLGLGLGCT